jgi:hypothetical protein
MLRLLPALLAVAAAASAQVSDPVFSTVPFDRWTAGGQAHLRWRSEIAALGLSNHQRLIYRVQVTMDGAELVKRRGKGEFLALMEFKDSEGRVFQSHGSVRLDDLKDEASHSDMQYVQDVFLTPGEYLVRLAAYATTTGEYALAGRTLRVDPLPRDPLPDAWRDLPPIEFVPAGDPPDAWFLPTIQGKLNLPIPSVRSAEPRRRIEMELLVNATPSEETPGTRAERVSRQMLAVVVPSMKTLAQLKLEPGSMNIAMLDLARQNVIFQSAGGLNWDQVKTALTETSPHMIDVGSLEKRKGNAQFFLSEVARRVEASRGSDALHVLVVLSAPMAFAQGEDLHPIQISAERNCKVFYIRYSPTVPRMVVQPGAMAGRRGAGNFPRALPAPLTDSLERTLKPLNPRLFEVTTPSEFRKSLAAMMEEIAHAAR